MSIQQLPNVQQPLPPPPQQQQQQQLAQQQPAGLMLPTSDHPMGAARESPTAPPPLYMPSAGKALAALPPSPHKWVAGATGVVGSGSATPHDLQPPAVSPPGASAVSPDVFASSIQTSGEFIPPPQQQQQQTTTVAGGGTGVLTPSWPPETPPGNAAGPTGFPVPAAGLQQQQYMYPPPQMVMAAGQGAPQPPQSAAAWPAGAAAGAPPQYQQQLPVAVLQPVPPPQMQVPMQQLPTVVGGGGGLVMTQQGVMPPTTQGFAAAPPPQGQIPHLPPGALQQHALSLPPGMPAAPSLQQQQPPSMPGAPGAAGIPSADAGPKQLIVNFLAPNVTPTDLASLFGRIGPIDAARVIKDLATNESKQFGFVYFKSSAQAAQAVAVLSGVELKGRRIKVSFANPQRPYAASSSGVE